MSLLDIPTRKLHRSALRSQRFRGWRAKDSAVENHPFRDMGAKHSGQKVH